MFRQPNIITAGTVWAILAVGLLGWTGAGALSGRHADSRAAEQYAAVAKVEHFYLVIAGERSGVEPGPGNKLARDLRDLHVPDGSSYAVQIRLFRGDSNRYGGVTRDLGFDPFEGPNCSECGPLDFNVQETVIAVKNGGIDAVVDELESTVEIEEPISGPPASLWGLWLASFPIYVGATYFMRRRQEESRYRELAQESALLSQIREMEKELPPGDQRYVLSNLASRLEEQMELRVAYRGKKKTDMRLDALVNEATAALESIEAGNRELT